MRSGAGWPELAAAARALAAASVLDYTLCAVSALPPLRPRHSMIPEMEF